MTDTFIKKSTRAATNPYVYSIPLVFAGAVFCAAGIQVLSHDAELSKGCVRDESVNALQRDVATAIRWSTPLGILVAISPHCAAGYRPQ